MKKKICPGSKIRSGGRGRGLGTGMGRGPIGRMGNLGVKAYGGAIAMGAMPTMGNANVASIQSNVTGGYAKFSESFPAVGKLAGAGMTINYAKKLGGTAMGFGKKKKLKLK